MNHVYDDSSLRNVVNSRGFVAKQITSSMYLTANRGALTVWGKRASSATSPGWLGVWPVFLYIPIVVIAYLSTVALTRDYPLAFFTGVVVATAQMVGIFCFKTVVSISRRRAWMLGRSSVLRNQGKTQALGSLADCFQADGTLLRLTDTESDLSGLHYGWPAPLACEFAARAASTCSESVQNQVYLGVVDVCSRKSTSVGELLERVQAVIETVE